MGESEKSVPAVFQLKSDIRISPFDGGPHADKLYLVEVGDTCFVANSALHALLQSLDESPVTLEELARIYERRTGRRVSVEVLSELLTTRVPESFFSHAPYPDRKTPFIFSFKLIPERFVIPFSSNLKWLFAKPVVIVVLCALAVAEYLVFSTSLGAMHYNPGGTDLLLLYAALIASTFFHELGHAAACRRYGCPHGDIGFALYFIFPAFYTDVTKAWRLPPRQRAIVDIGGVYFQSVLIVALSAYALLAGSSFALRVIWMTHLALIFTLNPVFKMDGYWLLTDLSGLTNLHRRVCEMLQEALLRLTGRPPAGFARVTGGRRKVLYAYVALTAAYSVFILDFLFHATRNVVLEYPARARLLARVINAALRDGDHAVAFRALTDLASESLWPLLLAAILFFMLRKVARALPKLARSLTPKSFQIMLPGWKREFVIKDKPTEAKPE